MVKILVVDDEQRIREMIRKYAEYEGFAVDEACDGLEAVDKAMKENYDRHGYYDAESGRLFSLPGNPQNA